MNGNLMYEMARQRVTEQQRTARRAGEARGWRAIARGRHARVAAETAPVLPAIPDYAHELFGSPAGDTATGDTATGDTAIRDSAAGRGRHSRTRR